MIPLIGWQQSVRFQVLVGCGLRCERTGQWDGGEKRRKKRLGAHSHLFLIGFTQPLVRLKKNEKQMGQKSKSKL